MCINAAIAANFCKNCIKFVTNLKFAIIFLKYSVARKMLLFEVMLQKAAKHSNLNVNFNSLMSSRMHRTI